MPYFQMMCIVLVSLSIARAAPAEWDVPYAGVVEARPWRMAAGSEPLPPISPESRSPESRSPEPRSPVGRVRRSPPMWVRIVGGVVLGVGAYAGTAYVAAAIGENAGP